MVRVLLAAIAGLDEGAAKTIVESGPTLTVIVRVMLWPPSEVKVMSKVVSPWLAGASASTGSMVKEQVLAVRVTEVSLVLSTPAAFEQEMVLLLSASVT